VLIIWNSNPSTARYFLAFASLGDLGHIYACYAGMGEAAFLDVQNWNFMLWMNVGMSLVLMLNRILTITGVCGRFRGEERVKED
jgi:hypothetical protein